MTMKKETKIIQIIDVAWELLKKEGIDNFSMRKLSEASDTTISSLYHYFKNKESIFQAMINKALEEVVFPVDSVTIEDKLKQYAFNILHTLEKYPGLEWLLLVYPPVEIHYTKILDHLLMIVDELSVSSEYKLYFVNIYMNFIITFQIDRLYQVSNQNNFDNQEKSNWSNAIAPYLNFYYRNNMFEKLGTSEVFDFGLTTLILGLKTMTSK